MHAERGRQEGFVGVRRTHAIVEHVPGRNGKGLFNQLKY